MLHRFTSITIAALALVACGVTAAPVSDDMSPVKRQLVGLPIDVDAAVGSATCPAVSSGNTANANVLAVVSVEQTLSIAALPPLAAVTVNLDVDVCLCLDASLQIGTAQADALRAAARAQLLATPALVAAVGVGNIADVTLTPTFTPSQCGSCPANQYPTCTDGVCGCASCPTGQTYNPDTNTCVLSPSGTSTRKRNLAAGWGSSSEISSRQAKRDEIVKRSVERSSPKTGANKRAVKA